jgi:hypothetical protein
VKVDLDEEALRDRIIEVIAGHAIVKPGETLVIRSSTWTPDQADQYQEYLDARHGCGEIPFRVLVVLGDGLAVAKPETETVVTVHATGIAKDAAARVERGLAKAARTRGTNIKTILT